MTTETWSFFDREPPWGDWAHYSADGLIRARRVSPFPALTVELGDSFGLSLDMAAGSRLRRSSGLRHDSEVASMGRAFLDRPGDRVRVEVEGVRRSIQLRLPNAMLERILLEDHDEPAGASILRPIHGEMDFVLLRLLARALLLDDEPRAVAIRAVVARLVSAYGERRPAFRSRGLSPARLKRVRDMVVADPAAATLAGMAEEAGLSVFHFSREFRREMGQSPWEFVTEQRVWHAVRRLQSGRRTIEDVARRSGFTHASHMGRSFRKILGAAPRTVRDRLLP